MSADHRARRVALGVSVLALAKRAGIDRATVNRIEAGDPKVRDTSVAAVERVLTQLEYDGWSPRGDTMSEHIIELVEVNCYQPGHRVNMRVNGHDILMTMAEGDTLIVEHDGTVTVRHPG